MTYYLENPFNPVMFITYKQSPNLENLLPTDPNVERTFHLDTIYQKLRDALPNLLCIGDRNSEKSTLLNTIFDVRFEVIHKAVKEKSAGLFHDSVDALFNSKEFPSRMNLFDFQGYAN